MEQNGAVKNETLRFKKRWLVYAFVLFAYLPELPGCIATHGGKSGRVVTADGVGVENAAVLAFAEIGGSGSVAAFPESRSSTESEYRIAAITDKNGYYHVGSTWREMSSLHFLPIFGTFKEEWNLVAVKPGFAMQSDVDLWQRSPRSRYLPGLSRARLSTWLLVTTTVDDIRMVPTEFAVSQASEYYTAIARAGGQLRACCGTPEQREFERQMFEYFLSKICKSDPEQKIAAGYYFVNNVEHYDRSSNSVISGEYNKHLYFYAPDRFTFNRYPTTPDPVPGNVFKSTDVCAAMKASGTESDNQD